MVPSSIAPVPAALIVGCGYLGKRLAQRLIARGQAVYGTTRSPDKARLLADLGVRPLLLSVTQRLTLAALRPAAEARSLDLFFLLPPGRPGQSPSPREILIDGMHNILAALNMDRIHRAVMSSSTAVYGQSGGETVSAQTPAQPNDERSELLIEAEQQWLGSGQAFHVARLAGLYGPGRVIGLQAVREGAPIIGDPQAMLNLIHVEDAADLLAAMSLGPQPGRIELGCDDLPIPRIEYYRYLAQRLGAPSPPLLGDETALTRLGINVDRLRRSASKRCDNGPTRIRTGWSPKYSDYRSGLEASLGPGTPVLD